MEVAHAGTGAGPRILETSGEALEGRVGGAIPGAAGAVVLLARIGGRPGMPARGTPSVFSAVTRSPGVQLTMKR